MLKQYLDCSTSHVTAETMLLLQNWIPDDRSAAGWPAMTVAPYEFGAFLSVPPLQLEFVRAAMQGVPQELAALLRYAFENDCEVVRLDADGDEIEGITTYDW